MLQNKIIKSLGLKSPIKIIFSNKAKKSMDAYYLPIYTNKGKIKYHKIKIYLGKNARDINTLIAHELIHAWQEEKGKTDIHGKPFKRKAKQISKKYNLPDIYIKGTDI